MTAPNMATIAASLERSLQNCSLNHRSNHHHHQSSLIPAGEEGQGSSVTEGHVGGLMGIQGRSSSSTSSTSDDINAHQNQLPNYSNDTALELNSHVSLPYHWEQCLDLKTGEIYYINWRSGMKAKEDPRRSGEYSGDYYYSEDENSSHDSEESSTESSPSSYRERYQQQQQQDEVENNSKEQNNNNNNNSNNNNVLVVAGCKACLMYFMVPKQLEDCPKCSGQLLHFDRSENGSP